MREIADWVIIAIVLLLSRAVALTTVEILWEAFGSPWLRRFKRNRALSKGRLP